MAYSLLLLINKTNKRIPTLILLNKFFFKKAQKNENLTVITGEAIDVGNTVISNERFYWKGKWVGMGSGHKFFKQVFFSKNQTKIKQKILSNKTFLFLFLLLTNSQS